MWKRNFTKTRKQRAYERYGTAVLPGWTVLDIGAGVGDFSLLAARSPGTVVYAFEPFPESLALLRENMRLNGITNVVPYAYAVGAETGTLALDLSGGEPMQMQSHAAAPGAAGQAHTLVTPSLSLADALTQLRVDACDLLKLDCEGAEYGILFQAPAEVLARIARIVMEYHDGVAPHSHQDLVAFLQAHDFTVQTHPNPVHPELGFLYAEKRR